MLKKLDAFLNSIPMLWVSGLCLLVSFMGEYILPWYHNGGTYDTLMLFAWPSIIISGTPLAYIAIWRIIYEKRISSALLITIAMIAAIYIGDAFAAAEIAFIMAFGGWLEERTVEKAKKGIEKLLTLVPSQGRKIVTDAQGMQTESIVDAQDIAIHDTIRVLPGESFPADGIIIVGNTSVDQSIITGESLPIDKTVGDDIFTGTINRFGTVDIKVTKSFANSSLQKMIALVEQAEEHKAPTQKIVDVWAGYFVPVACAIAMVTYLVVAYGLDNPDAAIVRAVTVLVVFCPCALALATPTSIMAAIGQATKNGVLIKSGEALEKMGKVTTVAFDKTGTITHGKLIVSDIKTFDIDTKACLKLIASVESHSEHPLAKALMQYTRENGIQNTSIQDFSMNIGKGVSAKVQDAMVYCGNERLIEEDAQLSINKEVHDYILTLRTQGKAIIIAAMVSATEKRIVAVLGLSDQMKESSPQAIASLKATGIHKTVLLTGDNKESASFMANKVGITAIYASLLPEGKVQAVHDMMQQGEQVCMVGDGVNDAPALKTAHVGIAMGTMGSDIAIDAADIAIMGDDITKISYIKKLSNATLYSIKFNICLAMAINFGAIILSVTGYLSPAAGALVHNAGSVLVVLNAARLYDKKIES
ncbi:MAG: cation-translocating P-type ATPase [Pseudomonadota bacterium]